MRVGTSSTLIGSVHVPEGASVMYLGEPLFAQQRVFRAPALGGAITLLAPHGANADFAGSDAQYLYTVEHPLNGGGVFRVAR